MNSYRDIIKPFLNRILTSILILLLLIVFIFVLIRLAPGDPTTRFVSPKLSPELAQNVQKSFGLNEPVYKQLILFTEKMLTGNFGISYNFRLPVLDVIKKYFLFTLIFSSISILIQLFVSFWLAKISFNHQGRIIDRTLTKSLVLIYSIPTFVIGLILIYLFSVRLRLFPTSGLTSLYYDDTNSLENLLDNLWHLVLPLITLSVAGISIFYKYLRDNLIAVSKQAFIVNLKAFGMDKKIIYKKHILPNAIQPLVSIAGVEFGLLLGGSLITEVIFALPGMGRLTINAIMNRDFPLVTGCTFIAGFMVIVINLLADLIKMKLDKRLIKDLIK